MLPKSPPFALYTEKKESHKLEGMKPTPTTEPKIITAGDRLQFERSLPYYLPADGWVLSYFLHNRKSVADDPIAFAALGSGAKHVVDEASANTAGWTPGQYNLVGVVTNGGERETIYSAPVTVAPDPANIAKNSDLRTHSEKVLDAIEAVLEGEATTSQQSLEISGDKLVKMDIKALLHFRNVYEARVKAERGDRRGRKVLVRF